MMQINLTLRIPLLPTPDIRSRRDGTKTQACQAQALGDLAEYVLNGVWLAVVKDLRPL